MGTIKVASASERRGPLFRRGRVRFVYWHQEKATEVAEASERAHHFEPSCCRGARSAIRRGPAPAGGGTGATGAGGAGVGAGAVAGTGESAPSFLESFFFFRLDVRATTSSPRNRCRRAR